jgi:hypothetical protein
VGTALAIAVGLDIPNPAAVLAWTALDGIETLAVVTQMVRSGINDWRRCFLVRIFGGTICTGLARKLDLWPNH